MLGHRVITSSTFYVEITIGLVSEGKLVRENIVIKASRDATAMQKAKSNDKADSRTNYSRNRADKKVIEINHRRHNRNLGVQN